MSYQWSKTDQQVGEGFLRIAREQIGKAAGWAENAGEPVTRRIHEARRRSKKLRALFRLVRPGFAEFSEANAVARDAARELAPFRDDSVLRDTLDDLLRRGGRPAIAHSQAAHEETDAERVALAGFAQRMRELERRTADWQIDRISLSTLAKGLRLTYRRGRQTGRMALRHRTDEAFHDWRKFAKYHWNQLGLLEDCAPDVLPSAHRIAGELANLLGLHHDLAILEKVLADDPASLGVDEDRDVIGTLIEARRAELECQIEKLGGQVFAEKPQALEARFIAYFGSWSVLAEAAD